MGSLEAGQDLASPLVGGGGAAQEKEGGQNLSGRVCPTTAGKQILPQLLALEEEPKPQGRLWLEGIHLGLEGLESHVVPTSGPRNCAWTRGCGLSCHVCRNLLGSHRKYHRALHAKCFGSLTARSGEHVAKNNLSMELVNKRVRPTSPVWSADRDLSNVGQSLLAVRTLLVLTNPAVVFACLQYCGNNQCQ